MALESDQDNTPEGNFPNGQSNAYTDEAEVNTPPSAPDDTQPDGAAEVRLPVSAAVLNGNGKKIGKVRKSVWYDLSDGYVGEFVREEDESVSLYSDGEHGVRGGYVDGNNNVLNQNNEYIATLRYTKWWLIILIAALVAALVLFTSLFAAFYTRPSEGGASYYPVLFVADDSGTEWDQSQNLPVFTNAQFGDSMIAPGLQGSYKFSFRNDNADTLAYNLTFSCENDYGIKVGYKLLRDNAVIVGGDGYVSVEELSCKELTIEAGSATRFELEWCWLDDDETDTAAGENSARYTLNISLTAWVA